MIAVPEKNQDFVIELVISLFFLFFLCNEREIERKSQRRREKKEKESGSRGWVRFRVGLFAAVKHVMGVSIPYVRTNYKVQGIWVFPNCDNLFENDIAAFC